MKCETVNNCTLTSRSTRNTPHSTCMRAKASFARARNGDMSPSRTGAGGREGAESGERAFLLLPTVESLGFGSRASAATGARVRPFVYTPTTARRTPHRVPHPLCALVLCCDPTGIYFTYRGEWDPDGGGTFTEHLISKRPSRRSARHRALQCARADQSGCRGPCGVCLEANFGRLRCAWVQLLHWDTLRQPHIA